MATTKTAQLKAFRVIVRGTVKKGKNELRVRRVRTMSARDAGEAALLVERKDKAVLSGLRNVYVSVLPPLH